MERDVPPPLARRISSLRADKPVRLPSMKRLLPFFAGLFSLVCLPHLTAEDQLRFQAADGEFAGWASFHEEADTRTGDVWTLREDGVLVCRGTPRGYLYAEKDFADFTLGFEWRWPPDGKAGRGGVLLRTTGEHKIWPRSLEVQLNAGDAGDFWAIGGYGLSAEPDRTERISHEQLGGLTHVTKLRSVEKPVGEWNHGFVRLTGSQVTVWMNGELVNHAKDCDLTLGTLVLTSEGSEIHFRNIRLTESPPAQPAVSHPPPDDPELRSDDYEVLADGQKVPVYRARTLDAPFADRQWDYGGPYSFANLDMAGPVELRISSEKVLKDTILRPAHPDVTMRVLDDHTLSLTMAHPHKLSLEPNGRSGPLLLFANSVEKNAPKAGDPNVLYYGPGVHRAGRIDVGGGQTLYLAGGSVVKGAIVAQGNDIRILGRGILDGSDYEWRKGPYNVCLGIHGTNVLVEGITIRGSSHWTIVPRHSRQVTIRNVKLCGSRVQNDDGINPCNSQEVLITDCFIRSDDDCVAMKGLDFGGANNNVEDITVEDSILWCDRARIFLLGHESRAEYMRRITLRNLDIIHFTMTPFLFEPGEEMRLEDVTVENVRLHGEGQREFIRLKPVVNQYMRNKVPGHVRNVTFRNVTLSGQPGEYLVQLEGADPEHQVENVRFENVSISGKPLTTESPELRIGQQVERVGF